MIFARDISHLTYPPQANGIDDNPVEPIERSPMPVRVVNIFDWTCGSFESSVVEGESER
jgi:hypothetical protein